MIDEADVQKNFRQEEIERLKVLAADWHHIARCKFVSATNYAKEDFGRRFIEHGAICYRNCAWALEREIKKLEGLEESQEYSHEANP